VHETRTWTASEDLHVSFSNRDFCAAGKCFIGKRHEGSGFGGHVDATGFGAGARANCVEPVHLAGSRIVADVFRGVHADLELGGLQLRAAFHFVVVCDGGDS